MAYASNKKPGELTALTSLATDDVFVVGDTSDASEVAKGITKANLITDLTSSFATAGHTHTGVYAPVLGSDDNYVTDAEKAALHAAVTKAGTGTYVSLSGQQITVDPIDTTDFAAGVLDTDLASTSASDDTVPSAKATKTALDAKAPLASPTFTGTVTLPVGLTGVLRADTGVVTVDTDVTDIVAAASTTAAGKIEVAIASEVNTGTDDTRAVSPDALAGSNFGIRYALCPLNGTTALTTSEKSYFRIPAALNGTNLVSVSATVGTGASGASSSGTPTFTVKNVTDSNQMLSTSLTVDANEYTSASAATAAVIDTTKDDVVTDDLIEVAVTTAGTGVTYCTITLGFALP